MRPVAKAIEWTGVSPESVAQQKLYIARRRIFNSASETLGALGEELIPMTSGEAGAPSTWEVLTVPATELPVPELPDDLIGADRVTRVEDVRGDNYVAWFPRRLKGYLTGQVKGRKDPMREKVPDQYGTKSRSMDNGVLKLWQSVT